MSTFLGLVLAIFMLKSFVQLAREIAGHPWALAICAVGAILGLPLLVLYGAL